MSHHLENTLARWMKFGHNLRDAWLETHLNGPLHLCIKVRAPEKIVDSCLISFPANAATM